MKVLAVGKPTGDETDLGTGQGRKRVGERTQEMVTYTGMWRRTQRLSAEAGRWRMWEKSRWKTYHSGRGGEEKVVIERGATARNAKDGGAVGGRR